MVMQRSVDEAKKCPRLDHPVQDKNERLKHDKSIIQKKKT